MQKTLNKKYLPWMMWGIALLFFAYRYTLDVFPGVAVEPLMQTFQVNATMLGVLSSLFFYPYALLQIPVGLILDKFGAKRLLTISALICALGALLFAIAPNFAVAGIGRFIMGIGTACTAVSAFYITATWLPKRHFTFLVGIILTSAMAGAVFGQAPIALLIEKLNWRDTMWIFVLLGLFLAALMWFLIKDKDDNKQDDPTLKELEKDTISLMGILRKVLKNPQNWFISILGGITFMPTIVFGSLWGIPFLLHRLNITNTTKAATMVSIFFIGWAIGAPTVGALSDYYKKRRLILNIVLAGTILGFGYAIYWPHPTPFLVSLALLFAGIFSGGSIIVCDLIRDNNRESQVGTALGFMNMLDMLLGTLGQPLVGLILDLTWQGKFMPDHTRLYSVFGYQVAFASMMLFLLSGFIVLLFIKESSNPN